MIMTTYWINISSEYRSFVGQKAVQIAGILHGESAAHFFKIEKGSKELVKVSSVWVVINPGYSLWSRRLEGFSQVQGSRD